MTRAKIIERIKCGERTVRNAIKDFVVRGWIEVLVDGGSKSSSTYKIIHIKDDKVGLTCDQLSEGLDSKIGRDETKVGSCGSNNWKSSDQKQDQNIDVTDSPDNDLEQNQEEGSRLLFKTHSQDSGEVGSESAIEEKPTNGSRANQIHEVFAHYRTHFPRRHVKPNAKMDEWKKINDRLDEGCTVNDLKLAIDGCMRTPHNQGENKRKAKYDSLDLIMRSGSNVGRFMEAPPEGITKGPTLSEEDIESSELFASWLGIERTPALDQIAVKNNADEISLIDIRSAIDKTNQASGIENKEGYFLKVLNGGSQQ
ncbi:MAG: hypothetical protein ACKVH8_08420 [Pirellulales bacterium]